MTNNNQIQRSSRVRLVRMLDDSRHSALKTVGLATLGLLGTAGIVHSTVPIDNRAAGVRRLPNVNGGRSSGTTQLSASQDVASGIESRKSAAGRFADSSISQLATTSNGSPADTVPSSQSAAMHQNRCRQLYEDARGYQSRGALASAEQSAWSALDAAAAATDVGRYNSVSVDGGQQEFDSLTATEHLNTARRAIEESWDFIGIESENSSNAIARHMRSHKTRLSGNLQCSPDLTARQVADLYLNVARMELIPVARDNSAAAEAMNLLASVVLARGRIQTSPTATALCLRRAAFAGQPQNRSLAIVLSHHLSDVGLDHEAATVLARNAAANPNQPSIDSLQPENNRGWTIERLTPAEFAAASVDVVGAANRRLNRGQARPTDRQTMVQQPRQLPNSQERNLNPEAELGFDNLKSRLGRMFGVRMSGTRSAVDPSAPNYSVGTSASAASFRIETERGLTNPETGEVQSTAVHSSLLKRIGNRIRHPFTSTEEQ